MAVKVVGQRSPRWAFWDKMIIPCGDGEEYLARLRLVQTPWFGIFLHDIYEPDADRDPHNHPWPFISILLRGSYTERVYPLPGDMNPRMWRYFRTHKHRRFSAHRMGRKSAHRITHLRGKVKTLIFTGKRAPEGWGFFIDGVYFPWQDYERDHA